MEKLTIQHIAPYLPYGLMGTITDEMRLEYISEVDMVGDELITFKNAPDVYFEEIENFKPHLLNISCLTKTIQHEGTEFIPIVELAKISYDNYEWAVENGKAVTGGFLNRMMFYYNPTHSEFICGDSDSPMHVNNQWQLFQKLAEWHIDFLGLIEKGLAIDKNTLK